MVQQLRIVEQAHIGRTKLRPLQQSQIAVGKERDRVSGTAVNTQKNWSET